MFGKALVVCFKVLVVI